MTSFVLKGRWEDLQQRLQEFLFPPTWSYGVTGGEVYVDIPHDSPKYVRHVRHILEHGGLEVVRVV